MAAAVYLMCAAASLACCAMLWRGYRRSRARFLLWSCLCFGGLTANNILLFADRVVLHDVDLSLYRSLAALLGLIMLLYGLAMDTD